MFNLPSSVKKILKILEDNNFECFVVGGCVRDLILGREPNDFDITTNARPQEVIDLFKDYSVIPTGLQHGTVTIILDHIPYEVTTYRADGLYSDHRRPQSVNFSNNLQEDLSRRDFTINAIAYNENTGLIDMFGSINDIQNKLIRCIGKPEQRFNEDALRILRALRFASQLGFTVEEKTGDTIKAKVCDLRYISVERIQQELNKSIMSSNFLEAFYEYGDVIKQIMPEINYDDKIYKNAIAKVNNADQNLNVRLAILIKSLSKNSLVDNIPDKILSRLKYSNKTKKNVLDIINNFEIAIPLSDIELKHLLNKKGYNLISQLISVKEAENSLNKGEAFYENKDKLEKLKTAIDKIVNNNQLITLKTLNINGNDLINEGFQHGKEIGETLEKLLYMVLDGKVHNNKDDLLVKAKEIIVKVD